MTFGTLDARGSGGEDMFVARVGADGVPIWLKSFGGGGSDIAYDVDSDAEGSAYVTGIATGNVLFGANTVNAGAGNTVTFKMDAQGTVQWAHAFAGSGISAGNEISVRPDGVSAIVGPYGRSKSLAPGISLPEPVSGLDLFVAVLEPDGSPRWARALQGPDPGGVNSEAARGVAFDQSGTRVLVTGVFTTALTAPPHPSDLASLMGLSRSQSTPTCFVLVLSETGRADSLRAIESSGSTICRGIVGDSFGQVQVAGKFTGTMFEGPNRIVSAGAEDLFVTSLSPDGIVEYARRIGGQGSEEGSEIESFADGEVFIFGDYTNNAQLPDGQALSSAGSRDLILARFGVAGNLVSFITAGGRGNDTAFALAVQPDATFGVVGTFGAGPPPGEQAQITFGSVSLNAAAQPRGAYFAIGASPGAGNPPVPTPPAGSGLNIPAASEYARNTNARSMVILQNGQMLFEGYYNGGAETRLELLASGSKSFSCVLAAAAVREQIIPDINVLASSRITSWAPGGSAPNTGFKQQIRVRDLLDLSSGLSAAGASGPGLYSVDSYAQAINVRSSFGPDTQLVYTPNHFQAFLAFFELATGGTLQQDGGVSGGRDPAEFLQTAVLDQIGVAISEWRRDIVGNPILAGGAFMTARDWARYGQLVLQNGRWNGAQILPAAIMSECRTPQSPSAANIYGLGWWLNLPAENFNPDEDSIPLQSGEAERLANGGKFIPTAPDDLFYAWGAGNMKLFIIPSRDLVVVRQGGSADDIEFFRLLFSS